MRLTPQRLAPGKLAAISVGLVWMAAASIALLPLSGCKGEHSQNADKELARAKKLIADGNFNEAFLQLNKALADAPRDPQIHLNLGWLYLYTDDPTNAERELKRVENLAPELGDTYKLRGDLLSYKGEHEKDSALAQQEQSEAVDNYQKALQRDPRNYQTYFDMAASLAAMNQYDEALARLDQGFDYIPKRDLETQVNFQIASCSAEAKLKLYDEAIADCQQAYEFTNSPASKERIEAMIENMKLLNPNGIPSLNNNQAAPPEGATGPNAAEPGAADQAVINEAASD